MILLGTEIRPPRGGGDDALLRLAAEVGADGIRLGAGVDLGGAGWITRDALRLGLAVPVIAAPLPERPLELGRRLPRLVAFAPDERAAAIALAARSIEAGSALGARLAVLEVGAVSLAASARALARAFARRELGDGEPGEPARVAALDERRARGAEVVDACRWVLEALLRAAERHAITLALPVGVTPWEAPSPRELGVLLETFAGAPLAPVWDPGRLSVLGALELPIADERLRAIVDNAAVVIENDAVGLDAGYLPGSGERDPRLASFTPGTPPPRIVVGPRDATDVEVAAAVADVRRGYGAPSTTA